MCLGKVKVCWYQNKLSIKVLYLSRCTSGITLLQFNKHLLLAHFVLQYNYTISFPSHNCLRSFISCFHFKWLIPYLITFKPTPKSCIQKHSPVKPLYIQTMEYYSVLRQNQPWKEWRNIKCILQSERSQSEKAT